MLPSWTDAAPQTSSPKPYSWHYIQPHDHYSPCQRFPYITKAFINNPKTPSSSRSSARTPRDARLLASTVIFSGATLSNGNKQVINWLHGHSETGFRCFTYRQKHVESVYLSTEPCTIVLVPVQYNTHSALTSHYNKVFSKSGVLPRSHDHSLNF